MTTQSLPITATSYNSAADYGVYAEKMRTHKELVSELRTEARIDDEDQQAFKALVQKHGGTIHVSVMTEERCSDSATNLPIVEAIVKAVPGMDMKIFDMKQHEELNAAYNAQGIDHIPVLTFFDAHWNLIGHWVERPAAASKNLDAWKASHAETIKSLEASGTLEDKRKLRELYRGIADEMATWYRGGLWSETVREIRTVIADGHL